MSYNESSSVPGHGIGSPREELSPNLLGLGHRSVDEIVAQAEDEDVVDDEDDEEDDEEDDDEEDEDEDDESETEEDEDLDEDDEDLDDDDTEEEAP
jgi:hypothetical protein